MTLFAVEWSGSEALELTYKEPSGTVTRNEILYSLNKPEGFIPAIVEFLDDESHRVHYVCRPFQKGPDFGVTSVNYDFDKLIAGEEGPS